MEKIWKFQKPPKSTPFLSPQQHPDFKPLSQHCPSPTNAPLGAHFASTSSVSVRFCSGRSVPLILFLLLLRLHYSPSIPHPSPQTPWSLRFLHVHLRVPLLPQ